MKIKNTYTTKDLCGFTKPDLKQIVKDLKESIKDGQIDYNHTGLLDILTPSQIEYITALDAVDVEAPDAFEVVFVQLIKGFLN